MSVQSAIERIKRGIQLAAEAGDFDALDDLIVILEALERENNMENQEVYQTNVNGANE